MCYASELATLRSGKHPNSCDTGRRIMVWSLYVRQLIIVLLYYVHKHDQRFIKDVNFVTVIMCIEDIILKLTVPCEVGALADEPLNISQDYLCVSELYEFMGRCLVNHSKFSKPGSGGSAKACGARSSAEIPAGEGFVHSFSWWTWSIYVNLTRQLGLGHHHHNCYDSNYFISISHSGVRSNYIYYNIYIYICEYPTKLLDEQSSKKLPWTLKQLMKPA